MLLIDYIIVVVYLLSMVAIGVYFQKKASNSINSFFLADKELKWWALGASGMASNLDVSGTMINTALLYSLGISGFFIEIRGGIVLILAFLMIYMGKWNRRAEVMTLAEWMEFRFGSGREGKIARLISALAILLSTVAIVSYFAVGAGKFISEFLGLPAFLGIAPEFWASLIMIGLAMIYSVSSGLYGVVWTDVVQGVLIFISISVVVGIVMVNYGLPDVFTVSTPLKDGGFISHETTARDWSSIIPHWTLDIPENSSYSIYNLFGISILFYLIKTFIEGSAGTGGYMIQRFYASKSDREAGLLSAFWTFLLSFRWPFTISLAIIAIDVSQSNPEVMKDPERVLPYVINNVLPAGLKGLLVAGLMAAAMSTFDSIINSGSSYWVKDIYQTFINKNATEKQLIRHSRWSSIILVVLGLLLTLNLSSINQIWGWLTMSMGAGLIIPLLVRWYWWRFNGYGFAAGVVMGMGAEIIQGLFFSSLPEYWSFLIVSLSSFVGSVLGTFLTKPTDDEVLVKFYKKTRPFGFWGKIQHEISPEEQASIKAENSRDIKALFVAVPWQLTMFMMFMVIPLKNWALFVPLFIAFAVLSFLLYKMWYRKLSQ